MYLMDSLKKYIEDLRESLGRIEALDTSAHKEDLGRRFPGSMYAALCGEMQGILHCTRADANLLARMLDELATANAGVETHRGTMTGKRPYWSVTIPSTVILVCPNCGAAVECEVERDDEIDTAAVACFGAQLETDRCEDCNKDLCAHCERFQHPDDKDLIQCAECHAHQEVK